jgi:hypothetical protein
LKEENGGVLVLPRPNLGPEPWPSDDFRPGLLIACGVLALALLFVLVRTARRRSRKPKAARAVEPAAASDSPSAQLLDLALQARESLATRFGPALRARTTEEISADIEVKNVLGDDQFAALIRLLVTADRWKFAPFPENGQGELLLEELPRWTEWFANSSSQVSSFTRSRWPLGRK